MNPKERAARSAVACVRSGQVLGLGTGSTAREALRVLAERIRGEGLDVAGVPTSEDTRREAEQLGIPLVTLDEQPVLDLAFDGADQVDSELACIKGYGGALLREKIVARCAKRLLIMVDSSKLSDTLHLPVPVEVLPFGAAAARKHLEALGGEPRLRLRDDAPYVTDNGNHIFDVDFGAIEQPGVLASCITGLPGVVDHGLFVGLANELHVGDDESARVIHRTESA
jgi:ribose 5-phosphate isomerase A